MIKQFLLILLAFAIGILSTYVLLSAMADTQALYEAKAGQHVTYNGMGFLKISGGER